MTKIKRFLTSSIIELSNFIYSSTLEKRSLSLPEGLNDLFLANHNGKYLGLEAIQIPVLDFCGVGGCLYDNIFFIAPANGGEVLLYDIKNKAFETLRNIKRSRFRFSGIGIYGKLIYVFPRSANSLLKIVPDAKECTEISLKTAYTGEHHYGGAICSDGKLYQPPRNTNHILVTDLNTIKTYKIPIGPTKMKYRYTGAILHPNGYIYMIPEYNQRVLKIDPCTDRFEFIGDFFEECRVLGPAVGKDGNVYGFLAFSGGIMKIDILKDEVSIIGKGIETKSMGTECSINGKLYSIPAYSDRVFEFDITSKDITSKDELCAGGIVADNGDIYTVPCFGGKIYRYKMSNHEKCGAKLLDFFDNGF